MASVSCCERYTFSPCRNLLSLITVCICTLSLLAVTLASHDVGPVPNYATVLRRRSTTGAADSQARTLPSGNKKPPQEPLLFVDTPKTISDTVKSYASKEEDAVEKIVKNVKPEAATFENTILPYLHHEAEMSLKLSSLTFYQYVSPNTDLVTASRAASGPLGEVGQRTYSNEKFKSLIDHVYEKQVNDTKLPLESRRAIEGFWYTFKDSALGIPKGEKRDRFNELQLRLSELANQFNANATNDRTVLWFTKEELNGTKRDVLSSLQKGKGEHQGRLGLSIQSPDFGSVISHSYNASVRERLVIAQANAAPGNVELLEQTIVLRNEYAKLLGEPNYATDRVKSNMAQTPKAVDDLLGSIRKTLRPSAINETNHLRDLKKKDTGRSRELITWDEGLDNPQLTKTDDDRLFKWDTGYYTRRSNEHEYNVDIDNIKEYFPARYTVQQVLGLYAHLFGLKFVRINGKDLDELSPTDKGKDLTWHPDVEVYSVWDADSEGGGFVGYIYLDLFYREGKKQGAFQAPIAPGFTRADGSRHYPVCALVCNFKKTDSDTPSLMFRYDVQTVLHEAGHGMHHLTSKTKYSRFHGPGGCPADFFEAPSQMMENYAYTPAVLKRLSKHWSYLSPEDTQAWQKQQKGHKKQPPETMPDSLINDILRNKNAYSSTSNIGQVFLSAYDMHLHQSKDPKSIDTTVLWNKLSKDYNPIDGPEVFKNQNFKWGHGQSTFTHIMSGYDASYYTYLWSKVYAEDMFYTAFKKDPFDSKTGIRWRHTVLQPGGAKDFYKIFEDFLGHKPTTKAFFEDLGIEVEGDPIGQETSEDEPGGHPVPKGGTLFYPDFQW